MTIGKSIQLMRKVEAFRMLKPAIDSMMNEIIKID
jgi:hypothetical protein